MHFVRQSLLVALMPAARIWAMGLEHDTVIGTIKLGPEGVAKSNQRVSDT